MNLEEAMNEIKKYLSNYSLVVRNAKYDHILFCIESYLSNFSFIEINRNNNGLIIKGKPILSSNINSFPNANNFIKQVMNIDVIDGVINLNIKTLQSINSKGFDEYVISRNMICTEYGSLVDKTDLTINKYLFGKTTNKGNLRYSIGHYETVYDDLGIEIKSDQYATDVMRINNCDMSQAFVSNKTNDIVVSPGAQCWEHEAHIVRNPRKFWIVRVVTNDKSGDFINEDKEYMLDAYYDFTRFSGFIDFSHLNDDEINEHILSGIKKTINNNPDAGLYLEKNYSSYIENNKTSSSK